MNVFDLQAKIGLDSSEYDNKLKSAEGALSKVGGKIKSGFGTVAKIGGVAIAAASGAVLAFGKSAVDAGMSFDSSMSQVAATMGKTTEEIEDLRNFAQEMGRTTAFSATEAADALNYMALAGYDSQTSMQMLPNVLNLAAAGGIDLASASDMVTDAQSALGLSLEETNEMVDKMAKASSKSNTSVAQLGEAFLTVGGTAKDLKGGTTELSAALGILADNGIKGSEGGTALRNILLALEAPTDGAKGVLDELGVSVFDAGGNMRDLESIFSDLNDSMSEMSQGEKTQVLSNIFNKVDLKSVNALLATNKDRWGELTAAIEDSQGAADQMAKTQLDNLEGDITLFKSALEGAQIAVSDKLTPSLREFVQFGSEGISELTEAFQSGDMEGLFSKFSEIIKKISDKIVKGLPELISVGTKLVGSIATGIFQSIQTVDWGAIADSIINPILEIDWVGIIESVADFLREIDWVGIVSRVIEVLSSIDWMGMLGAVVDVITAIDWLGMLSRVADAILGAIPGIVDTILGADWVGIAQGILDAFINGFNSVVGNLNSLGGASMDQILSGIISKLGEFLLKGADLIANIAIGIAENLPVAITAIGNVVSRLIAYLLQNAPKFLTKGVEIVGKLASGIGKSIPQIISSMVQVLTQLQATIMQNLPQFLQKGIELLGKVQAGIIQAVPQILGAIPGILADIAGKFTSYDWLSLGRNIISGIANGISAAGNIIRQAAENAARAALNAIKSFLGIKSPSRVFRKQVGEQIGLGLALGIKDSTSAVEDAMNDLNSELIDSVDGLGYDDDMSITKSIENDDENESFIDLLEEILRTIINIDDGMEERLQTALEKVHVKVGAREFGRLVRDVRTA